MMKKTLLVVALLFTFCFYSCEPSTVEGKAKKFNAMREEGVQLLLDGKRDKSEEKLNKAMYYFLKVKEEYSNDPGSLKKFEELTSD
jgi:hypothetical protein